MLRSWVLQVVCAVALLSSPVGAQQPADAQLPDAPQQQPQTPPPQTPSSQEPQTTDKKPDSKIKKTLKRGAPNCIKIMGVEKCKESADEDDAEKGEQQSVQQPPVPGNQPLPRSSNASESSSKDSDANLDKPGREEGAADVRELHPYDPHRADKDVEVGDFYFKRGNLRAAESRYSSALNYMPNHAVAIYKLAQTQEKLGKTALARSNYQKYLKILPQGEFAEPAKKALARLNAQPTAAISPPAENRR